MSNHTNTVNTQPLPQPKKTHKIRRAFGVIVIVIAVVIVAAAFLGSHSSSGSSSGPALTPGSATADQMCQTMVNSTSLQNTVTGQSLNETVVSYADPVITSNLNASGNEVATCNFTLDTGALLPATVTLFANGSTGMVGN
jgi:flagellar basal body-associated protein FliL